MLKYAPLPVGESVSVCTNVLLTLFERCSARGFRPAFRSEFAQRALSMVSLGKPATDAEILLLLVGESVSVCTNTQSFTNAAAFGVSPCFFRSEFAQRARQCAPRRCACICGNLSTCLF